MANNNRTNYNAMHNPSVPAKNVEAEVNPVNTVVEEAVEEVTAVPEAKETKEIFGIVQNCTKLNVRKLPDKTAVPMCVVTVGTELQIDINKSTVEWYSVRTASGVEGYCMKKFIAVK